MLRPALGTESYKCHNVPSKDPWVFAWVWPKLWGDGRLLCGRLFLITLWYWVLKRFGKPEKCVCLLLIIAGKSGLRAVSFFSLCHLAGDHRGSLPGSTEWVHPALACPYEDSWSLAWCAPFDRCHVSCSPWPLHLRTNRSLQDLLWAGTSLWTGTSSWWCSFSWHDSLLPMAWPVFCLSQQVWAYSSVSCILCRTVQYSFQRPFWELES